MLQGFLDGPLLQALLTEVHFSLVVGGFHTQAVAALDRNPMVVLFAMSLVNSTLNFHIFPQWPHWPFMQGHPCHLPGLGSSPWKTTALLDLKSRTTWPNLPSSAGCLDYNLALFLIYASFPLLLLVFTSRLSLSCFPFSGCKLNWVGSSEAAPLFIPYSIRLFFKLSSLWALGLALALQSLVLFYSTNCTFCLS